MVSWKAGVQGLISGNVGLFRSDSGSGSGLDTGAGSDSARPFLSSLEVRTGMDGLGVTGLQLSECSAVQDGVWG